MTKKEIKETYQVENGIIKSPGKFEGEPSYRHLGKRIDFDNLPEDCRRSVVNDYKIIWRLK